MAEPTTSQKPFRLLVVAPDASGKPLAEALSQAGQARIVRTLPEALERLGTEDAADFVLVEAQSLRSALAAEDSGDARRILDQVSQPVCVVNREGAIVWSNHKFQSYPGGVQDAIRDACQRSIESFREHGDETDEQRRQSLQTDGDYSFDLSFSPVRDASGSVHRILALAWDLSSTRQLQGKLDAIDAAGRELVGIDPEAIRSMEVGDRLAFLEEKIIGFCRDLLHFDHFAILLVDPDTKRLETLVASGITEADALNIYAQEEGNGICGFVAATGQSYVCPDVSQDPRYLPGLEGARSSLTVPLELSDRVIGVLNVESDRPNAFSERDRQFAEIFGRYVALTLHILQLLLAERHATTGQIAADVDSEAASPLNDIVSDVAAIMDDYAGNRELRDRLSTVLEDVDRVREAIHHAVEPPPIKGEYKEVHEPDPLLAGKRVLVADDEDIIRETISDVFGSRGALVTMARDGSEAIRLLRAQNIDLVLSDIKMPNRNGYEVFAAAREANPDSAVILITGFGYDPEHSIVRASREGLSGVLFKPFKVEKLMETVHAALAPESA